MTFTREFSTLQILAESCSNKGLILLLITSLLIVIRSLKIRAFWRAGRGVCRSHLTSTMEFLAQIVNGLKSLSIFTKRSHRICSKTGKYGPEKSPFLDTFHAVYFRNVRKNIFYCLQRLI